MFDWLSQNLATILVGLVLLAVMAAIVGSMIRSKRKGKPSCSCGCAGCGMRDQCHAPK